MRKVVSQTTQPTPPDGQTSAPKPTALPFQWSPAISCHVANGRGVQSTPNPSYTPKENVVYKNKNTIYLTLDDHTFNQNHSISKLYYHFFIQR